MRKHRNSEGFTLIEMLVVIAIVAILVAIIIPTVMRTTKSASAAADAANLRAVLGQSNVLIMENNADAAVLETSKLELGECKSFPNAHVELMFVNPGFIKVFYVDGDNYYGLDYFSNIADGDGGSVSTVKPTETADWYNLSGINGEG